MMPQITLILHNIRSTHNVGSIFRTAEGFGIHHIILSGYTPYPTYTGDPRLPHIADKQTKQIHKTALGAETMVPFSHIAQLDDWLEKNAADEKLPILALEQHQRSVRLGSFVPDHDFALLLGEEVDGIAPVYLSQCKTIFEIPMRGRKESFNVSVATGIALYALTAH